MKTLLAVFASLLLVGCNSTTSSARSDFYGADIRKLDRIDVDKEVAARIAADNWKFLEWYGGVPESTSVPGLTQEEGEEYIGSGRYKAELYFDQREFYELQYRGDVGPLIQARYRYAERFNRALLSKIRKENKPNQALEPTPIAVTPRAGARVAPATGVAHL
jgi:hypothetical protein